MNLELFPPAAPAVRAEEFFCHTPVDRTGPAAFAAVVRAPGDPDRRVGIGQRVDKTPHQAIRKINMATWRVRINEHLADGIPRTMNRIAVEMLDHTADTVFGSNFDRALWSLVEDGLVAHTMQVPILFRHSERDCG